MLFCLSLVLNRRSNTDLYIYIASAYLGRNIPTWIMDWFICFCFLIFRVFFVTSEMWQMSVLFPVNSESLSHQLVTDPFVFVLRVLCRCFNAVLYVFVFRVNFTIKQTIRKDRFHVVEMTTDDEWKMHVLSRVIASYGGSAAETNLEHCCIDRRIK